MNNELDLVDRYRKLNALIIATNALKTSEFHDYDDVFEQLLELMLNLIREDDAEILYKLITDKEIEADWRASNQLEELEEWNTEMSMKEQQMN